MQRLKKVAGKEDASNEQTDEVWNLESCLLPITYQYLDVLYSIMDNRTTSCQTKILSAAANLPNMSTLQTLFSK